MAVDKTNALLGVLGEIASLLHGGIASGLKIVQNLLTMGFGMAFKYNKEAVAFAREVGLNAKQAQAYTEVLTTRAKDLGAKYGIAAEAVVQLERNLSRATGRVLMLSNAEAERMVQINKMVGENTFAKFAEEIFGMGGQISTMQGAVTKAYAMSAKNGLNAQKTSEKIAQNLSMANRLSFKGGVDSLTRMAMLSEKFGMNMQSVESVANKFIDLQDAIESSAKLSMLGGAMGAFGGNPLDMAYEANYDPEALAERMTKMIAGYAQFDAKTGMSRINGMGMDFIRGYAQAMGLSVDEVTKAAKKTAEVRYKNTNFKEDLDKYSGGDEQIRDYLINKTQIVNGKMMLADSRGNLQTMDYYERPEGKAEWAKMMEFSKLSDDEVIRQGAESLISIEEYITGWMTTFGGTMAEKVGPYIPKIQEFLGDIFRMIQPHIGKIANNIHDLLAKVFTEETMRKIKSVASKLIDMIMWLPKFLTSSWTYLAGGALLGGMFGLLGWILTEVRAIRASSMMGGGAPGRPGAGARGRLSNWQVFKNARRTGSGVLSSAKYAANYGWNTSRALRNTVRGGGILTAALAGYEAYNAQEAYAEKRKAIEADTTLSKAEKEEAIKNASKERAVEFWKTGGSAVGTVIGGAIGMLGGPIGVAVGGAVGNWLGGLGGKLIGQAVHGKPDENYAYPKGSVIIPEENEDAMNIKSTNGAVPAKNRPNTFDTHITYYNPEYEAIYPKTLPTSLPYDGKTIIYTPQNTTTTTVGNNTITVKDINVVFSGSLRLEAGSGFKDVDIKEILDNDPTVMAYIAEKVRSAFNTGAYMKEMHDTAFMSGYNPSTNTGRMRNGLA